MNSGIIYFDNASTTFISESVKSELIRIINETNGNPSSLHMLGLEAERLIKASSKTVAAIINANPDEIYFTSGGTESNNTAIMGAVNIKSGNRIITVSTEHPSVLEPFKSLAEKGFDVVLLPVDSFGHIDTERLSYEINEETALVSIMAINNETGVMHDLETIGALIKQKNKNTLFHTDCVQAFCKSEINTIKCKIDLLSISGHKIHAPKGIGALYVRKGVRIKPLLLGGSQQRGLRSGTENTLGIGAFAAAASDAYSRINENKICVKAVKQCLKKGLERFGYVEINSPDDGSPYILNVSFGRIKSEVLLHALENEGVYVSSGSACSSKAKQSGVLTNHGFSNERINSAVRFSFSPQNTICEAEQTIKIIEKILSFLNKNMGATRGKR